MPGASFFEKSGTCTNGERRVQRVNEVVAVDVERASAPVEKKATQPEAVAAN